MAKYGYSRDKRNDRLQVNIGLVTDTNGYPISIEILEGNINDKSTLQSKVNELKELNDIFLCVLLVIIYFKILD
ncbi:hypothetical protein [Candidatus Vampirococcus lugosii]|uniref:Transposase n=1 Tax=Candidatus Vampirococcus lugosii TaxID=2789015 RepID=A0ABS5QLX1_9BACT|nr:hypothetical protein [Candidatus Vampirococcus lugosii]MBS8121959.1 Transposase [Candidatus Vampirococcus lugosii]